MSLGAQISSMCVHYVIQNPDAVIAYAKAAADVFDLHGETLPANAWPTTKMPVIVTNGGTRTLTMMRWGVLAPFTTSPSGKPEYIANARDDALLTKSIWKEAVQHRRCLIPADGFYEWAGVKGAKYEVHFRMNDGAPFFFAGVWAKKQSEAEGGFAIVTGRPNELVAALPHDRMPVILHNTLFSEWINAKTILAGEISALCGPFKESSLGRLR